MSFPKTYSSMHLSERKPGNVVPGETFDLQEHESPDPNDLKDGEFVFQTIYLAIDAASRNWIKEQKEDGYRSYVPPVEIGQVMRAYGIGRVVASRSDKFPIGRYAYGNCGWSELKLFNDSCPEVMPFELPPNVPLVDMAGVFGTSGMGAYFGIIENGKVQAGDVVVVSGAAGSVGSVAGQIAKAKGAYVIGICGSEDKCNWITSDLGFDEALNYKDSDFKEQLIAATPNFINLYYDNTGGEVLNLCFTRAAEHARFVICGASSQYNKDTPTGPSNYTYITSMRIQVQGFVMSDYTARFPEAQKQLMQWYGEGKLKSKNTIYKGGIKQADKAMAEMFEGVNMGKLLVEITPEGDSPVTTPREVEPEIEIV